MAKRASQETTKRIFVLANSMKHAPSRCIAGREIVDDGDSYSIGDWIRPVSAHDEGALFPSESLLTNGDQPQVMDIVEIPVLKQMSDPLQPENWLIDKSKRWELKNDEYSLPDLNHCVDKVSHIWREPDGRNDRVSATSLSKVNLKRSIRLIHLPSIRVQFEWNVWDGEYKLRRRALFQYNGVDYDLGITDPIFIEKYRDKIPEKGQPSKVFTIRPRNGCYLCVSLAPEFNGYHYKVVATILEG